MPITVERVSDTTFKVTVTSGTTTARTVTVTQDYWQKLTGGKTPAETLIEKSFEFLLEREPNTNILRSFDLPTIQSYFPEYERTLRKMLK